jgi:hypothetical protein
MTTNVSEVFTKLKNYKSGVVITQKIHSPTCCLDFDQSANVDSPWYGKGRFHNCSPYISSITEEMKNDPDYVEGGCKIQHLQNAPRNAGLYYTPSTKYFLKENLLIMIFHKNRVTSYPNTERAAKKLGVSIAPVLFKGKLESEEHFTSLINDYTNSRRNPPISTNERPNPNASLVVRALGSFSIDDFYDNVFEF